MDHRKFLRKWIDIAWPRRRATPFDLFVMGQDSISSFKINDGGPLLEDVKLKCTFSEAPVITNDSWILNFDPNFYRNKRREFKRRKKDRKQLAKSYR